MHNVAPHESGAAGEERLLEKLDDRTTVWIRLNETTDVPEGKEWVDIPHGHYRSVFGATDRAPVPGRMLQFGLLRPYKGVEALIAAFCRTDDAAASLRIVGKPYSAEYGEHIVSLCANDPRITTELDFVPDSALADEVRDAELVVLPYTEMHNSGVILVSLSLDRPVLAPRTRVNEALAAEVGPGWIHFFDDALGPEVLVETLHAVRTGSGAPVPDLSARDWEVVGLRHRDAYRRALQRAR
ncbi:glycosyltransferase [Agromyces sp. NPDC058110]|uniref:glycosyltransferase n=1 Tax=Agromyces sp. NPDC058110 TaxID=3346345 RepID=UPI0036D8A2CB